jgi:hypothetical protein
MKPFNDFLSLYAKQTELDLENEFKPSNFRALKPVSFSNQKPMRETLKTTQVSTQNKFLMKPKYLTRSQNVRA